MPILLYRLIFNMAAVHRRRLLKLKFLTSMQFRYTFYIIVPNFKILLTHTVQTNLMSDLIVCLVFHLFQFDLFRRLFCNFIVVRVPFQTFSTHGKTKLTLCRKCSYSPSSKWQSIQTSLSFSCHLANSIKALKATRGINSGKEIHPFSSPLCEPLRIIRSVTIL